MRSMSKQRNKIIFAIVISMMISACGVKEDVQKERGTDEGLNRRNRKSNTGRCQKISGISF